MFPRMGTVTHHGWSTSEDEIPQLTSIVTGENLRASLDDPVVALMKKCNIPITRQNYLDLAYCGQLPEWGAELESNLPAELQDWSQFERVKPLPPPRRARRKPHIDSSRR
jgi:hypothetical protein